MQFNDGSSRRSSDADEDILKMPLLFSVPVFHQTLLQPCLFQGRIRIFRFFYLCYSLCYSLRFSCLCICVQKKRKALQNRLLSFLYPVLIIFKSWCACRESNLDNQLRRLGLYPLRYRRFKKNSKEHLTALTT